MYLYVSSNAYSFFFASFLHLFMSKKSFPTFILVYFYIIVKIFPLYISVSDPRLVSICRPKEVKQATLIVPSLHSHVAKSHVWKEGYACDDARVPTLS